MDTGDRRFDHVIRPTQNQSFIWALGPTKPGWNEQRATQATAGVRPYDGPKLQYHGAGVDVRYGELGDFILNPGVPIQACYTFAGLKVPTAPGPVTPNASGPVNQARLVLAIPPLQTTMPSMMPTTLKPAISKTTFAPSSVPSSARVVPFFNLVCRLDWLGDGWCDSQDPMNSKQCMFDGGDCCNLAAPFFDCQDPSSPNYGNVVCCVVYVHII